MRTEEEINKAIEKIGKRIYSESVNLSQAQIALLYGIINGMSWCKEGANSNAVDCILTDKPFTSIINN